MRDLRVFAIDNSITFQNTLVQELSRRLPSGSLVEHAAKPAEAMDKLPIFKPTIIVMNFALGSLLVNQEKFLPLLVKKYPQVPIVTYGILESGQKAAMILGASHYLKKPSIGQPMEPFYENLVSALLVSQGKNSTASLSSADIGGGAVVTREIWRASRPAQPPPPPKPAPSPMEPMINVPQNAAHIDLIAMGASTGGTEALSAIITKLEPPLPGIVIVQHIPPMFSKLFSERLNTESKLTVKEAVSGDVVLPNHVYIAPGAKHMTISRMGTRYMLECKPGPPVHSVCPSVDVLFDSVADIAGNHAMGIILTGIGKDGAAGLLKMRNLGSPTIGQDAASSTVYGMPKAAFEIGAVQQQLPLLSIPQAIYKIVR
ncbi:putative chemotaxis response regulator protein-glutamate methylesterase [Selenomonas ruminantium subsp. lactilytica TAM6421]|uniref:protein-glutamate methylesterase n=1 Tax=Selenomonas ruminantium subsp. lactilytica (strain NBRC 103574 / TAM6421) TaxID=927704 RepID=I0GT42_SELRL|nr:chemotaxis protein CheB [Selenomonas ruminantium]BAL83929.1 putative chemotaxis response regulator protein-glutamate methylesterase [Selenomonas ruminantium subsp. lactilytica TAM6421]